MRKFYFIFFILSGLFSCHQTTDAKKNSAELNWSKDYRKNFISNCISKASAKVTAAQAFNYCDCIADKVEAKYNDEKEASANFSKADEEEMNKDCPAIKDMESIATASDQPETKIAEWSTDDQQDFMDNCIAETNKKLGKNKAIDYCKCMMSKIMLESPSSKDVGNISKARLNLLGKDCLGTQ